MLSRDGRRVGVEESRTNWLATTGRIAVGTMGEVGVEAAESIGEGAAVRLDVFGVVDGRTSALGLPGKSRCRCFFVDLVEEETDDARTFATDGLTIEGASASRARRIRRGDAKEMERTETFANPSA